MLQDVDSYVVKVGDRVVVERTTTISFTSGWQGEVGTVMLRVGNPSSIFWSIKMDKQGSYLVLKEGEFSLA